MKGNFCYRLLTFCSFLLALGAAAKGQNTFSTLSLTWNVPSQFIDGCETADHNYIGIKDSMLLANEVIKFGQAGTQIWSRRIYKARFCVPTADSGVVIGCNEGSLKVLKLDVNGNVVWRNQYSVSYTAFNAMDVGPDGNIHLLVFQSGGTSHYMKLSPTGSLLLSLTGFGITNSLEATSDNGVIICRERGATKLTSTGAVSWSKNYVYNTPGPATSSETYYSVTQLSDGTYVMGGSAGSLYTSGGGTPGFLVRMNSSGVVFQALTTYGLGSQYAIGVKHVEKCDLGGFYVMGYGFSGPANYAPGPFANYFDPFNAQATLRTFPVGPAYHFIDKDVHSLRHTPDGGVVWAGGTGIYNNYFYSAGSGEGVMGKSWKDQACFANTYSPMRFFSTYSNISPLNLWGGPSTFPVLSQTVTPLTGQFLPGSSVTTVYCTTCPLSPGQTNFTYTAAGLSLSFNATSDTAVTYSWNFGDGTTSTQEDPTHVYAQSGCYTVSLTVTSSCGPLQFLQLITVGSPVYPNINLGPNTGICPGGSLTLNAGAGYTAYLWSGGSTSQTRTVNAAGTYSVTVTNSVGCAGADTIVVSQYSNPAPSLPPGSYLCPGTSTTLNPGAGFASYLWTGGATTPTLTVSSAGTYAVTVTNAQGCSATSSAQIFPAFSPSVNLGPDRNLCPGASLLLDAGFGFTSYLWTGGSTTQTRTVNAAGTYSVTVSNSQGCTATDTVLVNAATNPVVNLGPDLLLCSANSLVLDAGAGFTTYQWSGGGTGQTRTVTSAGTYSVTVTNAQGCTAADTLVVSSATSTLVNLGPDTLLCNATSLSLNAGPGFASYLWSGGGTGQTMIATVSGSYAVTVTNAQGCTDADTITVTLGASPSVNLGIDRVLCPGGSALLNAGSGFSSYLWSTGLTGQMQPVTMIGVYSVTVTNSQGCSDVDTVVVNAASNPVVNLGPDIDLCAGSSALLDAGAGFGLYHWSGGATTQTQTVSSAGIYSVTVTNSQSCTASDTVLVIVHPSPVVDLGADTMICAGAGFLLDAGAGYAAYQWSSSDTTQSISPVTAGIYSVTVTDAFGCEDSDEMQLTVQPLPVAGFTSLAAGFTVQFTDQSTGTFSSWLWDFGGLSTSTLQNPSFTFPGPGTHVVCLTVDGDCGSDFMCTSLSILLSSESPVNDNWNLFPNPASDLLHLTRMKGFFSDAQIRVINALGQEQKVQVNVASPSEIQLDAGNLPAGMYLLLLTDGDEFTHIPFEVIR